MIAEIGLFALILALPVALVQGVVPIVKLRRVADLLGGDDRP